MLRAIGVLATLVAFLAAALPVTRAAATPNGARAKTKAGYIHGADHVCREYDRKLASIPDPPSGSPLAHHEAYARWGERTHSVFEAYDHALGAIPAPASAGRFLAAWHKVKRTAQAYIAKFVADGVLANFEPQAKSLIRANKSFGKVAGEYGFADCGRRYRAGKLPH